MNGAMYNCYLFMTSVINVVNAKYASFVDTTDIYTSFLFNLLAQSLQIRNYSYSMETYLTSSTPDYVSFVYTLASMINLVMSFSSSNSQPFMKAIRGELDINHMSKNMMNMTDEQIKETQLYLGMI